MKIRTDFVSNSSSSSFIILAHKDYSDQKVAEDFIDYAFNIKDLYIWENYKEQYLKDNMFFEAFSENFQTEESKIEHLRNDYNSNLKYVDDCSNTDKLNKDVNKLVKLFSMNENERKIYLPYPYHYDDNDELKYQYTAKLSPSEMKALIECYPVEQKRLTELKTELEAMTDDDYKNIYETVRSYYDYLLNHDNEDEANKLYNKEFVDKWFGTISYKERQHYLDYVNMYLKYNDEDYKLWLNNISGIDNIDNYNAYVINVANSGDGEDDDSIYSYLSDRNQIKYDNNKYCFTIMSVEPM